MKNKYTLLTVFSLCLTMGLAQDTDIVWDKTLGGSGIERCRAITATADGGAIVLGFSNSDASGVKSEDNIGLDDYWVVKLDSDSNLEWENTIGGSGSDIAETVIQTTDGGYIVGGYSSSTVSGDKTADPYPGTEYWLVKLNSAGVVQWDANIGGTSIDYAHNLLATPDNGCLVGGRSESDMSADKSEDSIGDEDYWVVKLDSNGDIEWENTIGGPNSDYLWDMENTTDNGYILAGVSFSGAGGDKTEGRIGPVGFSDLWIVKINGSGAVQWDNTIGGTDHDRIYEVKATSDGGFILGAHSESDASGDKSEDSVLFDYWVLKINSSGTIMWENTISANADERLRDLIVTSTGEILVAGYTSATSGADMTDTSNGGFDAWLVTLDQFGDVVSDKLIGGSDFEGLFGISQSSDGSIYLGTESFSDISGDKTEDSYGLSDYWVVKMDNFLSLDEVTSSDGISLYPNPTNGVLQVSGFQGQLNYSIYNALGQNVMQAELGANAVIDVAALKSGLYFIRLEGEGQTTVRKFIKQ